MGIFISTCISVFFAFGFAIFQFSLVLGAPFGEYVLGGMNKILPKKIRPISVFLSILFFIVGLCYLQWTKYGYQIFGYGFVKIMLILYTAFLFIAIFSNGFITKSKKEKYFMTPLSLIGFISSLIILS